jgi:signal transduction histidine kinase
VALYPLIDHANEVWGGVYVTHEITERKKMEWAKDEMISAVSHEMRTPLTAILGFVEFMLNNEVDREQQIDFLRTVLQETERLNELISNFLDLQRLQAEIGQYQFAVVEICPLLEQAVGQFQMTSQKHILQIECSEGLPLAKADARRILQVIKNLVSNAVKYSPEGGEIVCAARQEGGMLLISVRDQGMGIALAERERIFEQFYRIDDSEKRIPGGIGLGLALVREVVRAHGGRVWLESEVGAGSTFYFSLPIAADEQVDSEPT